MEKQAEIQISYVELEEVDPAPFINKLINEVFEKYMKIEKGD